MFIFLHYKCDVAMRTLQTELIRNKLSRTRTKVIDTKNTKSKDQSDERFSRKEWEEMMGVNRDTYKRGKGGAIRRR